MGEMKERLHESGFCEHGFRENRKCHQCEPEPDELERLMDRSDKAGSFEHRWQWKSIATDALAEIKRLQGIEDRVGEITAAYEEMRSKLQAITEAEPVRWESLQKGFNKWHLVHRDDYGRYAMNDNYEVRALIVKPKGDPECPTKE